VWNARSIFHAKSLRFSLVSGNSECRLGPSSGFCLGPESGTNFGYEVLVAFGCRCLGAADDRADGCRACPRSCSASWRRGRAHARPRTCWLNIGATHSAPHPRVICCGASRSRYEVERLQGQDPRIEMLPHRTYAGGSRGAMPSVLDSRPDGEKLSGRFFGHDGVVHENAAARLPILDITAGDGRTSAAICCPPALPSSRATITSTCSRPPRGRTTVDRSR
jgi:hypothetical protein